MGMSRPNHRGARRTARLTAAAVIAAALTLTGMSAQASPRATSQEAAPAVGATEAAPVLLHGWMPAPFGTRTVKAKLVNGIVRLRGAVSSGTDQELFFLPPNMRPGATVYVPVDLCGAANGRLIITSDGRTVVQAEGSFSSAQCFTSLDGAWFMVSTPGSVPITLQNGWSPYGADTRPPKAALVGGVVYLKGAIQTGGSSHVAFTLPAGMRPPRKVYVPVDLCESADGRLKILPNGTVTVQADEDFSAAQCFTSLEGASFTIAPAGRVALPLVHQWTNSPFNTRPAMASLAAGVVRLEGAIATNHTNPRPFTLPASMRPDADVYIQVDLCGGANGRLVIGPSGVVTVEAEDEFAEAQCFTSLEGASFVRG
jgi:hypothetical protein